MVSDFFCVSGRLTAEEYEPAIGRWYALGMQGCEEAARADGTVDVKVYFRTEESARAAADDMRRSACGDAAAGVAPVVNEDWNARWRQSMRPAKLAPSWWVSPLWLPPPLKAGDRWIKIEPKMAFGTGHHETTRLAAQALIACGQFVEKAKLLDIGTGSGVLCFVAATAGAARCIGIEIDRECQENLAENRALNNDAGRSAFVIGPVDALKPTARFNLIVMNMIHTESAPLLDDCQSLLADRGVLIWSGILFDEKQRAIEAAEIAGFNLEGESAENEWWCGRFSTVGVQNIEPVLYEK